MDIGERVVPLHYASGAVGKAVAETKWQHSWGVQLDGRTHSVDFTNTITSGKKRIFVDGRLQHEATVWQSASFNHTWLLGEHLLSIMPIVNDEIFGNSFELRIDGQPFHHHKQRHAQELAQQRAALAHFEGQHAQAQAQPQQWTVHQGHAQLAQAQPRQWTVHQGRSNTAAPVAEQEQWAVHQAQSNAAAAEQPARAAHQGPCNAAATAAEPTAQTNSSDSSGEEGYVPFKSEGKAGSPPLNSRAPESPADTLFACPSAGVKSQDGARKHRRKRRSQDKDADCGFPDFPDFGGFGEAGSDRAGGFGSSFGQGCSSSFGAASFAQDPWAAKALQQEPPEAWKPSPWDQGPAARVHAEPSGFEGGADLSFGEKAPFSQAAGQGRGEPRPQPEPKAGPPDAWPTVEEALAAVSALRAQEAAAARRAAAEATRALEQLRQQWPPAVQAQQATGAWGAPDGVGDLGPFGSGNGKQEPRHSDEARWPPQAAMPSPRS